jgi:predicted RNA-binding Zn ribbon-like protein
VSGNPALDLVGTVGSRRDKPVDLLVAPTDLEQWVLECDELPDRVTADVATFTSALQLREAIHQLALDRMRDRRFAPAGLAIVNDAADGPVPTVELSAAGLHLSGDLRSALAHVARSGIAVLADRRACLKECGRSGCTRLYLDRSRGARRTWCGMEGCGNRVKAAAYRARRQAAEQDRDPGKGQSSTAREPRRAE